MTRNLNIIGFIAALLFSTLLSASHFHAYGAGDAGLETHIESCTLCKFSTLEDCALDAANVAPVNPSAVLLNSFSSSSSTAVDLRHNHARAPPIAP